MKRPGRGQGGVAAVELAVMLPFVFALLACPAVLGRAFYYQAVAQKAAHDAALYLATVAQIDMATPARAGQQLLVAQAIIAADTPGMPFYSTPSLQCDGGDCGNVAPPTVIRVQVRLALPDNLFSEYTFDTIGFLGLTLQADVTMAYVGN